MRTLLKSIVVWLLLLAMPFQGFAAATMLVCAPLQPAQPISPMRALPHATMQLDHHAMASAAGSAQEHHHHVAPSLAQATETGADTGAETAAGDHSAAHHAGGNCNTCAICCFGASMAPPDVARVPAEGQHYARTAFNVDHIASVDLALPERPPQTSLT